MRSIRFLPVKFIALYYSYAFNYQKFCRNHKCKPYVLQKLFDRWVRFGGHIGRKSFMSPSRNFVMCSKINSIGAFRWTKNPVCTPEIFSGLWNSTYHNLWKRTTYRAILKFPKISYRKLFFHLIFARETEFSDILAIFGFFGKLPRSFLNHRRKFRKSRNFG